MSDMPQVLFAHERPAVIRAVSRVLEVEGFSVRTVRDGDAAVRALAEQAWDAFVCDVGLPGIPGYELCARARHDDRARAVVLVASVYRRTSYKRRPTRLYGADDYVEIHHLGDQLPSKLRHLLGEHPAEGSAADMERAKVELEEEGDARLESDDAKRLASLIVADMLLYNGDRILASNSLAQARVAVGEDLGIARDLFEQVLRAERRTVPETDMIAEEFGRLMHALGRGGDG